MLLKPQSPWKLSELINNSSSPIPDEKGTYLVAIPKEIYNIKRHGPSQFICIGGTDFSLSFRVGLFITAIFGFKTPHSEGNRFFDERGVHKINPWDLIFWWYPCNDSKCCEVRLFEEFVCDFNNRKPLLNKIKKNTGCGREVHRIEIEVPWRK